MQGMTIIKVLPYNKVLEKIRSDAIARNFLIRSNKTKSYTSKTRKRKATEKEILEMRRLREVEHMRLKEISALFPDYSYDYVMRIVNYYIAANVGVFNQLKRPCITISGNQYSSKVKELI